MSACEASRTGTGTDAGTVTGTGTGTVSRVSDAPAFNFDVRPEITQAAPPPPSPTSSSSATSASASTSTAAAAAAAVAVKIENKCPAAEATAFSYQRAAKRAPSHKSPFGLRSPDKRATGFPRPLHSDNPCEAISRQLALRKARLKADFFGHHPTEPDGASACPVGYPQSHYSRAKSEPRKPVQQLIEQFQAMIVQQEQQQQQQQQLSEKEAKDAGLPGAAASNSDEGCNVTGSGLSPYSSDNEEPSPVPGAKSPGNLSPRLRKGKVTRCASSDSALGLEVDDPGMDGLPMAPPQRRMTLTVTDLPLRPALLPLAEPTALPDSPLTSPTGSASVTVPTKVLLEERVVAAPGSRRESTQSSYSELGSGIPQGVRYVRTPSVVVSDYSDDITACGISMEEMEYFRLQRARCQRRCSLEAGHGQASGMGSGTGPGTGSGCGKDDGQSDVSAASSCSNLYYCGSTISALDGGECIVNGVRVALARKGSTQSSSLSDEEEELEEEEEELEEADADADAEEFERGERELESERQLSELLAATQLSERQRDRSKKVGAPPGPTDVTNQGNLKKLD